MEDEAARTGETDELAFHVDDLAAWLGPDAVEDVLAREDLRALLENRRICIPRADLERWLRELQARARAAHDRDHA
ncbi:MAG TPA: hypothetical protein VFC33_09790 [Acidimicrobiia bacterium]|nr:hypothetical protein [Acidimicrobiia bacterium]